MCNIGSPAHIKPIINFIPSVRRISGVIEATVSVKGNVVASDISGILQRTWAEFDYLLDECRG